MDPLSEHVGAFGDFQDREQIRVVISHQADAPARNDGAAVNGPLRIIECAGAVANEYPIGPVDAGTLAVIRDLYRRFGQGARGGPGDPRQFDIFIRYVYRNDAVGLQVPQILAESFDGDQVYRNRIA